MMDRMVRGKAKEEATSGSRVAADWAWREGAATRIWMAATKVRRAGRMVRMRGMLDSRGSVKTRLLLPKGEGAR